MEKNINPCLFNLRFAEATQGHLGEINLKLQHGRLHALDVEDHGDELLHGFGQGGLAVRHGQLFGFTLSHVQV